ncbi:MAG: apolipoprotein N-acyltransferase [Nakamurella sp.]
MSRSLPHPALTGLPGSRPIRVLLRLVSAVAGGLAVYGSFAPSTLWWLAPIGLALTGLSVTGLRGRSAFWVFGLAGASFYVPLLSWTGVYVGAVPWLALAIAEALLTAPVGLALVWLRRLPAWPLWAAGAWVAGEALRARWPFGGFGWGSLAFGQPDGPLLPLASLFGSTAISFAVATVGFSLTVLLRFAIARVSLARAERPGTTTPQHAAAGGVRRVSWRPFGVIAGVVVVAACSNLTTVHSAELEAAPTAPIAVIQGNVPRAGLEFNAQRRAVLDNHAARTHELAAAVRAGTQPRPSVVLWPENSSDIDPFANPDAAQVIQSAADDIGAPILVGAVVAGPRPGTTYNMGIVWNPGTGATGETYTKRHPVPFAEYMPYRSFFRTFSAQVDLLRTEFLPGDRPGNFTIGGVPIGDLICFEIVENDLTADVVRGGARVLVVQTNNATFGYTDETYQQQAMSRVRAVEYGREVLITATSGVSAVIRPDGSVAATVPLFTPGFLVPTVPLLSGTTLGGVLGPYFEWTVTVLVLLALGWTWWRHRRQRGTPTATGDTVRHDPPAADESPTGPLPSVGAAVAPAADRAPEQEEPRT